MNQNNEYLSKLFYWLFSLIKARKARKGSTIDNWSNHVLPHSPIQKLAPNFWQVTGTVPSPGFMPRNMIYDQLAPFYPLIYGDWKAAMTQQAAQLSSLIGEHWGTEVKSVLDVSCGIGTQTLGLASLGYEVTASDLSAKAIQVAQQEADQRGLNIPFAVCDMRVVDHYHHHNFDILISCDNSVPHLLTDEEILQALRAFRICIRPGGGCIISLRNYEQEPREQGVVKPYGVREAGSKRYLLFQVWDWDFEGAHYDLTFYFVEDDRQTGHVQTHVMRSRYYAISPDQLLKLMAVAGFVDLKRLDDVYFQPIIIGTNPSPNFPN